MNRSLIALGLVVSLASGCGKLQALRKKPSPAAAPGASAVESATAPTAPPPAVPDGYARVRVAGVVRLPHGGDAVLLLEDGTRRAVPIFVGATEALSIDLRLKKKAYGRPLTHDLYDSSVAKLGGRVESVRVDKVESNVFYGTLILTRGGDRFELDARPSDAIAIALGNNVPIHVARKVIDHAAIDLDQDTPPPAHLEEERPPPVSL
ncbi:MAG: bifunctional nuclease family protein [Polyangiaceae bacterium]